MTDENRSTVVRRFLCSQTVASLSTLSLACDGYPFGSLVPYDIDAEGNLLIFISLISEHYKNISADPRVSLLVSDRFGIQDPQAHARATFVGDAIAVPDDERGDVETAYWKRFPFAPERAIAHSFLFFRISAVRVRWIGGFGDIRWISPGDYAETAHDPVAYESKAIIDHMNDDHRDALQELAKHKLDIEVAPEACSMVAVDSESFTLQVQGSDRSRRHRLSFSRRAGSSEEVRSLFIEALQEAREAENADAAH